MNELPYSDEYWMLKAIELAKLGCYTTKPNPMVGCVIVKDNQLIGQGFHPKAGFGHAEVYALQDAHNKGHSTIGATAYVTLEPCAHFGKTPPCALALSQSGVSHVVMASLDSNPLVSGKGKHILEEHGITTSVGICEHDAQSLNRGFLRVMAQGLPFVRAKIAASLDGKTAMANGESKWITGTEARLDVQTMRAKHDAIITGINTMLDDDPMMNVRDEQAFHNHFQLMNSLQPNPTLGFDDIKQPWLVILDRHSRLHRQLQTWKQTERMIWCTYTEPTTKDCQHILLPQPKPNQTDTEHQKEILLTVLKELAAKYQVYDVMVEAGATLTGAFFKANLVDACTLYIAPTLLGTSARDMTTLSFEHLSEQYKMNLVNMRRVGNDICLELTTN